MYLQTHSRGRRLYVGVSEFSGFRTSFEMVELKSAPHHYTHLAGLLDVFKAKVVSMFIYGTEKVVFAPFHFRT
jgi:Rab3 GTPase-activating protein catalytic subunit